MNIHTTVEPDTTFPERSSAVQRAWRRWPIALGIGVGLLTAVGLTIDESLVRSLAGLTTLIILVYVGASALQRRSAAWPILLIGLPVVFLPDSASAVAIAALLVATAGFAAFGIIRARTATSRPTVQTVAALGFITLVLAALAANRPTVGAVLLAVVLLGHAGWDLYHHRGDRVVPRTYAEFCAVFDSILAAGILAAL